MPQAVDKALYIVVTYDIVYITMDITESGWGNYVVLCVRKYKYKFGGWCCFANNFYNIYTKKLIISKHSLTL